MVVVFFSQYLSLYIKIPGLPGYGHFLSLQPAPGLERIYLLHQLPVLIRSFTQDYLLYGLYFGGGLSGKVISDPDFIRDGLWIGAGILPTASAI